MPRQPDPPASPIARSAASVATGARRIDMRAALRVATSEANSEILTGLREIVRGQVATMLAEGRGRAMTAAQAGALHRIAQTYQLLAAATDREQARYDLSRMDSDELADSLDAARELLGRDGT